MNAPQHDRLLTAQRCVTQGYKPHNGLQTHHAAHLAAVPVAQHGLPCSQGGVL